MRYLLLLLLIPTTTIAQALPLKPLGCYVEVGSPLECSNDDILCSSTNDNNYIRYGLSIGSLCDRLILRTNDLAACNNQAFGLAQVATLCNDDLQTWSALATKRQKKIRRLKRKLKALKRAMR